MGKTWINCNGYVMCHEPTHPAAYATGQILEHRKVWYDAHGLIPDGVHIHHVNGDRTDNRLDNLTLIDVAAHGREHAYEGHAARWNYSPGSPCHVCGASEWRYRKNGRRDCIPCGKAAARARGYKRPPRPCPECGVMLRSNLSRHLARKHPGVLCRGILGG